MNSPSITHEQLELFRIHMATVYAKMTTEQLREDVKWRGNLSNRDGLTKSQLIYQLIYNKDAPEPY